MSANAIVSAANDRRIRRAQAWLEIRAAAEEVLIVGATLDAANELARKVAKKKGAAFGWHRLTLSKLAFAIAAPILAARGLTPLSRNRRGRPRRQTRKPPQNERRMLSSLRPVIVEFAARSAG